jgi:hypothetical protein
MSDLVTALRDRISALVDERGELEDTLSRINVKIETYEELLSEETGDTGSTVAPKRTKGRPRGSKNKKTVKDVKSPSVPEDELLEQAVNNLPDGSAGTSAEEQRKAIRRFNPAAREASNYGVKAGNPKDVLGDQGKNKSNVTIEVED